MINKLSTTAVHTTIDENLNKYVQKKIGQLDNYVPKHARKSVQVEVKLKEDKATNKSNYTCEVIVQLPHEIITVSETTINFYAAIDIAEAKLKQSLKKYKDLHSNPKVYHRLFRHLRREQ
jgi:ribosomal subunit interface protein